MVVSCVFDVLHQNDGVCPTDLGQDEKEAYQDLEIGIPRLRSVVLELGIEGVVRIDKFL